MALLFAGSIILIIACTVSVICLKNKAKEQFDIICGMQIFIFEHTGRVMDEETIKEYKEYWRR